MQLLQNGKQQFIDQNGAPLVGGQVFHYAPGTTNPVTTYKDQAGQIANTNPIQLDSRGQAVIWAIGTIRQVVTDASGVTLWDQLVSAPDVNAPANSLASQLLSKLGASLIGFIQAGAGAIQRTLQDKGRERISINDFGAAPSASVAVNTAAIKAALLACPSGGLVEVGIGGTYAVASSAAAPITIDKRLIFDGRGAVFQHDGVSTGTLFKLGKDSSTPATDLNFNSQLEYLAVRNLTIQGAKIPNGAVDNRTSVCDAIVLDGGLDGLEISNVSVEGIKGAGVKFAGNGSIRESYFDNITLRYCGNGTTQTASLDIVNVADGDDPHNEIHWSDLRIIYSAWSDMEVRVNPKGPASAGWPRLWYFNNFQFENESSSSNYWNTAPNCDKVRIAGANEFYFGNGNSLNSYGTDSTKWGKPHFHLGDATNGYVVQSIAFDNVHFQNSGPAGFAIHCENVGVRKLGGGCTFQFVNPTAQARTEAIGKINATDSHGTFASATYSPPYQLNDPSEDMGLGTIAPDNTYMAYVVGRRGKKTPTGIGTVIHNAGGFSSGLQSIAVPAGGGAFTVDLLAFMPTGTSRDDLSSSRWAISADIAFYGAFAIAGISVDVKCFDTNTVPAIATGASGNYNGNLALQATTFGGAAAASLVGGAGGKFQINVTNTTGQALMLNIQAVRLGG